VFCLYYNRIFLKDSTKIVIFAEKSKCGNFLEMRADFSTFVYMDRGEIIIYQTADGETCLDVRMENDSVWLTQAQIAQLFGTEIPAISKQSAIFSRAESWGARQLFPKWK